MRILHRAKSFYGSHPLHLLVLLACFALFAYVIVTVGLEQLWNPDKWWQSIAVWFVAAVVAHDLLLFPLYAIADRSVSAGVNAVRRRPARRMSRHTINYVRIPVLASALTGVMFLPGIVAQGKNTYLAATGLTQDPFLERWLLLCATFFVLSAATYAVRHGVSRRTRDRRGRSRT